MSIGPANDKRDEILAYMGDINRLHQEFLTLQTHVLKNVETLDKNLALLSMLRTDLAEGIKRVAAIGGKLAVCEDRIKMQVVEEIEGNGGPAAPRKPRRTRLEVPEEPSAAHPGAVGNLPPKLAPGKRACGICRRPGHRATTCPQKG